MKAKNSFTPMIVACKDNAIIPTLINGDRDVIKATLETIKLLNPDWFVFMDEIFMKNMDVKDVDVEGLKSTFRHGDLEREFKSGFKDVVEGVLVNTYMGDKRLFVTDRKSVV